MEIKIDEEIYDIRWRHERNTLIDSRYNIEYIRINPNGGRTVAYIFNTKGKPIEAYANCSVKDTYNKHLGRVIATGRLLKKLGLNTKEACKI